MAISDLPDFPPLDGSLTIPEALDFHLKHNRNKPIYVYNNEDRPQETTRISYLEFARACDRIAHVVRPDRAGKNAEVVGVIALVDTIVYQAIIVGLMRAGLIAFPISPRNSPPAIINLLKKTSCHRLLVTQQTLRGLTDEIKSELAQEDPDFELRIEEVPTVHQLYPKLGAETLNDPFEPYPPSKQRPALTDVALYFHSSGSTGFPKPIPETHLAFHEWSTFSMHCFREHRPRLRIGGMALPAFHILGFYVQVLQTLYGGICVSVYPPAVLTPESQPVIPTSDNIIDNMRRTRSNALIIIPTLLQGWKRPDEAVQVLKDCEYVGFAGGPLPRELGKALVSADVNLQTLYGATEFGAPTIPRFGKGSKADWDWMGFSPRTCLNWADQGDGTYEARFMAVETHHPSVENMQDLRGYSTSDVFEKHPTKENLWRIIGRKDDVIIHSSGEKTVPGPMETMILNSPIVKGAVIFGREHDHAGLLLEPMPSHQIDVNDREQLAELRNKVWSVVEKANKNAPAFSRIFKEMILITSAEKPLPRSGKESVMRKYTLELYKEEIDTLYKTIESNTDAGDVVPPETWERKTVSRWLLKHAQDILPGNTLSPSRDLFDQGFDSLSASFLRLRIVGALRDSESLAKTAMPQNMIYAYPTIERLALFVVNFIANPAPSIGSGGGTAAIEEMIAKYSVGLDAQISRPKSEDRSQTGPVILITGSTGNLGSQVLASLLQDSAVRRVYALNRPSRSATLRERHRARFADKCLDSQLLESEKLILLSGDTADNKFGLSQNIYDELRNTVATIIHIAWRLDFNLSLSSFEPNVRGTRNLIDLARSSPHASKIRFVFTSSIASAQSWGTERGRYPEEVVHNASFALGGGYGEGKYVAERILNKSGLHACSLRVGQISGGLPNGAWATSDWVPIFVKSSLALGVLPDASGLASWLPMDTASDIVLDIAFANEPPPFALNLAHPRPVTWSHVMQLLRRTLLTTRDLAPESLSVVPFQEWISRLEAHPKTAAETDFQRMPALKLLDFFKGMARADSYIREAGGKEMESGGLATFETEKAQGVSETMREVQPIGEEDVTLWVKYWDDLGFFD